MADLNRYNVRLQVRRVVSIDAINAQQAKALAESDVADVADAEKITAQSAVLVAQNVGQENGQTLDRFDVTVRFRRNLITDALDYSDARYWAEQDQSSYGDTEPGSFQVQVITFVREKTGVSA